LYFPIELVPSSSARTLNKYEINKTLTKLWELYVQLGQREIERENHNCIYYADKSTDTGKGVKGGLAHRGHTDTPMECLFGMCV